MNLRKLAEAAVGPWPRDDATAQAFVAACTPERVLALLDVAEAAAGTPDMTPSGKAKWWREDGLAGRAAADSRLRAALARWREAAG